jgi:hypothetical protein
MKATTLDRFFDKVDVRVVSGCWEWTGEMVRDGYGRFYDQGVRYPAHRVTYMHFVGDVPHGMLLDHICHNPKCVNPHHLRLATPSENQWNSIKPKNNTSGLKGVSWYTPRQKWRATLCVSGKKIYLGLFSTSEAAHTAYCIAVRKYHGEFANLGHDAQVNKEASSENY